MIWNPFKRPSEANEQPTSLTDDDDRLQARTMLDVYLKETRTTEVQWREIKPKEFEPGRAILKSSRELQVDIVVEAVGRFLSCLNELNRNQHVSMEDPVYQDLCASTLLLRAVLRKKLPFDEARLGLLVDALAEVNGDFAWDFPFSGVIRHVEFVVDGNRLTRSWRLRLRRLRNTLKLCAAYPRIDKAISKLTSILQGDDQEPTNIQLTTGEAWTNALTTALESLTEESREQWNALLIHCAAATSSKPSQRWLKQAASLIDSVNSSHFTATISACLAEIGKPGIPRVVSWDGAGYRLDATIIDNTHSDLLRGLVWCTCLVKDERLIVTVGDVAEICYKKIPGHGPRAPKIGNACLYALSSLGNMKAVAYLSRLKTKVKHASVRQQLNKALERAADIAGMLPDELEEVAVPDFGLTSVGEFRQPMGDCAAWLTISDTRKTDLRWIKPDGKVQKSVPAAIKEHSADQVKAIKRLGKDIEKMLPAQRDRIEQLFLQQRTWPWKDFRSRYLDHPLVGTIARRLIWRFRNATNEADGIWYDGQILDRQGGELGWLDGHTNVELWHPILGSAEEIMAWRQWLEKHEVRQPFKQAHREVYILTDAERNTETYSNRFAAHVLKQHQFSALCQQRGWRYALQGAWDSHNTPCRELPLWEMRTEFWVDAIDDHEGETSEMGIFLYVSTDQVRFCKLGENAPMSLEDIPPLVFSEVMRDVDLFVGVASVGNDPNWSDGGPEGRYRDYWHSYSFGDLSATAQTRKEVLGRLIPRLKIAERCSFSDKFLVVRGEIRTYKIHLGSGNVLMSPNDQYLCIVPGLGAVLRSSGKIFLPFEGDNTMSIILSKAFLLADDTKIKDPTILSQIGQG